MLSSVLPLVLLLSGMLPGSIARVPSVEIAVSILLYFLPSLVGVSLGSERVEVTKGDLEIPIVTAAGTLVAAAVSPPIGLPLKATLIVASGFGWYTLAGPLVTGLLGAEVGAVAFLPNPLREVISLAPHRTVANDLGAMPS